MERPCKGKMKLWECYNGYLGAGAVTCLVIAEKKETAIEMAREKFKQDAAAEPSIYGDEYYSNITAFCLCDDVAAPWASKPSDQGFAEE